MSTKPIQERKFKAILSNRIYMTRTEELWDYLLQELTYKLPSPKPGGMPEFHCSVSRVNNNVLTIPIGRTDLIPDNYEIIDKRTEHEVRFPKFRFKLRPTQAEILDDVDSSFILNANPAFGKTFCGVAAAVKLKQKTLIIVHTVFLRQQWEAEVEKCLGIKAGVIGSGKYDIDSPIVVANIQSLKSRTQDLVKTFGTIVTDECLDYESLIDTKEKGLVKIGNLVNNKMPLHVKSWNGTAWEYKKVLNYYKNRHTEPMIKYKLDNGSSLKCTMNHNLYTYRDYKIVKDTAENITIGEWLVCAKSHKTANIIDKKYLSILLGCIIGDGNLARNNTSTDSVRVRVTNGEAQIGYLNYKKNILKEICEAKTVEGKSGYKPENKVYTFSSLSFTDTFGLYNGLYKSGTHKGTITKELSSYLTNESWSLIYMDDGSISNNMISFHVYLDSIGLGNLIDSLRTLFNINPYTFSYQKNNKELTGIKLNTKDSKSFIHQIEHLIHPELDYKKGTHGVGRAFTGITSDIHFEEYAISKIVDIDFQTPTGNSRFNIEVEDNHNYVANGKLVANCHHIPANTFKETIDKFHAKYKIGLSATLWRKDGKHVMIYDYVSKKVYKPIDENALKPTVTIVNTGIKFSSDPNIHWGTKVSNLINNPEYIELVLNLLEAQVERGHTPLLVSDRVELLETCNEILPDFKLIIGATTDRTFNNKKDKGILGSVKIFSEGINVPDLSCLVLGLPVNNKALLEQLIGRVNRMKEGKKTPEIIDIALEGTLAKNQLAARINFYSSKGYKIRYI